MVLVEGAKGAVCRLRDQKLTVAFVLILWDDFIVGEPIHRTLLRQVQSCIRGCLAHSILSVMVLQADQRCNSVSTHLNQKLGNLKERIEIRMIFIFLSDETMLYCFRCVYKIQLIFLPAQHDLQELLQQQPHRLRFHKQASRL